MADPARGDIPERLMSRDEYRAWAEARPRGRYERIDGAVVAVAP